MLRVIRPEAGEERIAFFDLLSRRTLRALFRPGKIIPRQVEEPCGPSSGRAR